jgi:hypothetical protein
MARVKRAMLPSRSRLPYYRVWATTLTRQNERKPTLTDTP